MELILALFLIIVGVNIAFFAVSDETYKSIRFVVLATSWVFLLLGMTGFIAFSPLSHYPESFLLQVGVPIAICYAADRTRRKN